MNIFKFLAPFMGLFSRHLKSRLDATNFVAMLLSATTFNIGEGGGSVAEQELLEKVRIKAGEEADKRVNEYAKGLINRDEFKKSLQDIVDKTQEESVKVADKLKEVTSILEKQGEMIKAFKQQDRMFERQLTRDEKIKLMVEYASQQESLKAYHAKAKGTSETYKLCDALEALEKKTISVTGSYTGTLGITRDSGVVVDIPRRTRNVRDILVTSTTDQPNIYCQEIYDWSDEYTGSASMLAENAAATEGSFKVKESSWGFKRIAAFFDFSKTAFRTNGLDWLNSYLGNVLPGKVKFLEDSELLYGDGSGNHITGININCTEIDFAGTAIAAGAISSVVSWNGGKQSLITFAAKHGIQSGDNLTIANSANYNGTYRSVVQVSAFQIIIKATYVNEATAAWTGTYFNPFYKKVDDAQEIDVLLAVLATQKYKNRPVEAFLINSTTAMKMMMLKDTAGRYLDKILIDNVSNVIYIAGVPCIEVDAVAPDQFFGIRRGAQFMQLLDFSPMSLFFSDDVTYDKENKVCAIIEEEVIFPIYEPLSVCTGEFETLKAQLQI